MPISVFILSLEQTPETARFLRRSLLCAQLAGSAELDALRPSVYRK